MSRDRRRPPQLEPLEGKRLLSTVHFDHIVARPAAPLVLNGTLNGSIKSFVETDGSPMTLSETFSGRVRSMGAVKAVVTDQLDPTSEALLGGGITLRNGRGTVQLTFAADGLLANQTTGTLSTQVVSYTVSSGTGAYAGATGAGTFTLMQNMNKSSTLVLETKPA